MNIFTFKKTPPIVGHDDLYNRTLTHRQWAVTLDKWSVGLERQNIYKTYPKGHTIEGYWIGIETEWEIIRDYQGYFHDYYDGDMYTIRIGPLYLTWFN